VEAHRCGHTAAARLDGGVKMGRKQKPTSPDSLFYGCPVEQIAAWCGVSLGSAEHYKTGRRQPSAQAMKLFELHRDGKVLGAAWHRFRVVNDELCCSGARPVKPIDVEFVALAWQTLADKDPRVYNSILAERSAREPRIISQRATRPKASKLPGFVIRLFRQLSQRERSQDL